MRRKDLGLLLLILAVGAVVATLNPRLLSPVNGANTANLVGLIGIGSALVIVTGGIDLSAGSMIALLGAVVADLAVACGAPGPLLILIVLGVTMGVAHGLPITRVDLQPFVVTLWGLLICRRLARCHTADGTAGSTFGQSIPSARDCGRRPHARSAAFGRHLFALGKIEQAARCPGLDTAHVAVAAYVIGATMSALAGVFFAMNTRSVQPSSHGNFSGLYGIAAPVLGTILLQVLWNLVNLLGIPSSPKVAVMGGVILVGAVADRQVASRRERRHREVAALTATEAPRSTHPDERLR